MSGSNRPSELREKVLVINFEHLVQDARSQRFSSRIALFGWVHLVIFALCEVLFLRGDRTATHFLPLWGLDVLAAAMLFRPHVLATSRMDSAQATRLLLRVWLTFAILCLSSASLNSITGFEIDWFKISWAMLGTFGFAMLAWVLHLAFLIPAVQMSLTALLIAAHPEHAYAIFGVSWFAILQGMGLLLKYELGLQTLLGRMIRRDRIILKRRSQEV